MTHSLNDPATQTSDGVDDTNSGQEMGEASWRRHLRLWVIAAATMVIGAALFTGGGGTVDQHSPTAGGAAPLTMHEQHHGQVSFTNEAEFLVEMIPHHEEAIVAARQLLAASDREEMRVFARTIIAVQQAEVDTMLGWLDERHPGVDRVSHYMPMMRDYAELTGDELDRAFLADMIPHHMTAVMMGRQLVAGNLAEHDDVAPFATTIAETQFAEVRQMMEWMTAWFGPGAYSHTMGGSTHGPMHGSMGGSEG